MLINTTERTQMKIPKKLHSQIRGRQNAVFQNFGNMPVIDGTDPLRLQPTPEDANGAICKSPTECVLARCARRMYGSTAVVFLKTSCYVDMLDADDVRRVHRWPVPPHVCTQLKNFDRGMEFKIGQAIILPIRPPRIPTLWLIVCQ